MNNQSSFYHLLNIIVMDIGIALAVFLTLSIALLALFCFITKYFHHKIQKSMQENIQIYSMIDDMNLRSQEGISNEFDDYKKKEQTKKDKNYRQDEIYIQLNDMKSSLAPSLEGVNIYGKDLLRRRLNGQVIQSNNKQQSSRSISQLKSFKPDRLITTNRKQLNKKNLSENEEEHRAVAKHSFVKKLICYDSHGIHVVDVIMISIKNLAEGKIKENKKVKTSQISNHDDNFENQLQILGFQKNEYACYKHESEVQINQMKPNEQYMIKSLKASESRQMIEIEQYVGLRHKLQSL